MVMMMVVMVMMAGVLSIFYMAMVFVAMLALSFKLKGSVHYTVLTQFLAYLVLDMMRLTVCDNMHGCIAALSIQAPHMDMVNVQHAVYLAEMLLYLIHVNVVGSFLKKQVQHFPQVIYCIHKNEYRNTNGHKGVEYSDIGKTHDHRADQYR